VSGNKGLHFVPSIEDFRCLDREPNAPVVRAASAFISGPLWPSATVASFSLAQTLLILLSESSGVGFAVGTEEDMTVTRGQLQRKTDTHPSWVSIKVEFWKFLVSVVHCG
jgi:hypothetical protein